MKREQTYSNPSEWYKERQYTYELLAKKVESILNELITDGKVYVHDIKSRAKELSSFNEKIKDPKYSDPINQITDLAGIRIITYVESDLDNIAKLVEEHFEIDRDNSIDKTKSLGTDKVGYRSVHYIAKLSPDRLKLPEYSKFTDLSFEIQIRTILQHAWAEIEHDKDYKFSGELPAAIKRRFKVLSGVLELADREFNQLAEEIDSYRNEVTQSTKSGNLNIEINSTSLDAFLEEKLSDLYKRNKISKFVDTKIVIEELRTFGIINIEELDKIFTDKTVQKIKKYFVDTTSTTGILRTAMMLDNTEKYFEQAWKGGWSVMSNDTYKILKNEHINIDQIMKKYNISPTPNEQIFKSFID